MSFKIPNPYNPYDPNEDLTVPEMADLLKKNPELIELVIGSLTKSVEVVSNELDATKYLLSEMTKGYLEEKEKSNFPKISKN